MPDQLDALLVVTEMFLSLIYAAQTIKSVLLCIPPNGNV
jgi:hypothetical protein